MRKILFYFVFFITNMSVHAAPLQFRNTFIPESPPAAAVMAAYFEIINSDNKEKIIDAVSSEQFDSVEIHRTILKDDVAHMEKQSQLLIPAKGSVQLKQGGLHLMLIKPKHRIYAGDSVTLKIHERDGTEHALAITVQKANAITHQHHHHE